MSVIAYRDAVLQRLQDRCDALTQRAVDARVQAFPSADVFALTQADTLAEARAFAMAHQILREEYKRLYETVEEKTAPADKTNKKEPVYG